MYFSLFMKKVSSIIRFDILNKWSKEVELVESLLENPNRKEILNLVKRKEMNITQIKDVVGIAYKNILPHIKMLEKYGLVKIRKDFKSKGKPVYVQATGKTIEKCVDELKIKCVDDMATVDFLNKAKKNNKII